MDLRLPRFLISLRAGGELGETRDGAEAWLAAGDERLDVRVPAGEGPVRLSGAGEFLGFFRWADGTIRPLQAAPGARIELDLRPGDALVCFTPEAARVPGPDGEPFGAHRIAAFLHLHDAFNAPRLAEALLAELERHAGGRPPDGTVACLVIEAR